MPGDYQRDEKSVFNMSINILERLARQIDGIDELIFMGDYNSAYRLIRIMKSNIKAIIKNKDDIKEIDKIIIEIGNKVDEYNQVRLRTMRQSVADTLFHKIISFKETLTGIMQERNMYLAKSGDARFAALNRG